MFTITPCICNVHRNLLSKKRNIEQTFFSFAKAMAENEVKIANLQREKEELQNILKNAGNSGKLSDQRKKRVEELEAQLTELKKKVIIVIYIKLVFLKVTV